jgi:hypothetical protein
MTILSRTLRLVFVAVLMATVSTVLAAKDPKPDWQKAVVVDQLDRLSSGGADDLPRMFGIPAQRQHKILVLDTEQGFRVTLEETAWRLEDFLILTVNQSVSYYKEKDSFIMLDAKGKKHKFALLREEKLR